MQAEKVIRKGEHDDTLRVYSRTSGLSRLVSGATSKKSRAFTPNSPSTLVQPKILCPQQSLCCPGASGSKLLDPKQAEERFSTIQKVESKESEPLTMLEKFGSLRTSACKATRRTPTVRWGPHKSDGSDSLLQSNSVADSCIQREMFSTDGSHTHRSASVAWKKSTARQTFSMQPIDLEGTVLLEAADMLGTGSPLHKAHDTCALQSTAGAVDSPDDAARCCKAASETEVGVDTEQHVEDEIPMWLQAPHVVQHHLASHGNLMQTLQALGADLDTLVPAQELGKSHNMLPDAISPSLSTGKRSVTDAARSRQVARSTGLTPLKMIGVSHCTDPSEGLDTQSTTAEVEKLQMQQPLGLVQMRSREYWLRSRLHDPLAVVPPPHEVLLGPRHAEGQREKCAVGVAADCRDGGAVTRLLRQEKESTCGASSVVIAFRHVNAGAYTKPVVELGKLGKRADLKSMPEMPYGSGGCCSFRSTKVPTPPRLPSQLHLQCKRPGELNSRPKRESALPAPRQAPSVQVDISSRFDSEQGFADGLYDAEQNVLYVR